MTETVSGSGREAPDRKSPAGRGLTIERIFTTPGVHPYDEVTWERRDVVQTNWKTGGTVFEQRGVEFPDFWSVNASTIVTSKYFRGAVGTDQREWSLRQLVDRVVKTYRAAGEAHGYFATRDDAEVFEHELTWMLMHQVFSFNSPVWFNVGTTAPQQVSACQPYDSLVSTPRGLVPIGELVESGGVGEKVFDAHGLTRVIAVKDNGVKQVLRLHLESGQALDVTADHLVWRSSGGGSGSFVEAGHLRPGDRLEWHRHESFGEAEIDPRDIGEAGRAGSDGSGALTVPSKLMTAPLPVVTAYLRSLFQSKGYVSARSPLVGLDVGSEDLIRGVQALLTRYGIFARVGCKRDERPGRQGGSWSLRIQNPGDRRAFADHVGFIHPVRAEELERSLELPGRGAPPVKQLQIASVEVRGDLEVYDIQTESGEYLSQGLRVHNCFILSVDDTMESILNWYKEEGRIFKGGSGAGLNLSRIRSSKELLSSGGTASGPVSFMRGADASAGTIKSGGATRRAAKMVVLDIDHPDIEEFVETKAREEDKIRALRDAGFDMDLGGRDITSVQYQNANNSVRVSDEFMRAVENGTEFGLRARLTGEVLEDVDAKTLFHKISQAAWECADPGLQYDDTINDWHTSPETGRITASNPCFPADQRVVTDRGLVPIGELVSRAAAGEKFEVYTNDVTADSDARSRVVATRPVRYMVTGTHEILLLQFSDGSRLRCTPNHRMWTRNRGWVRADDLQPSDRVTRSFVHAPRPMADQAMPDRALVAARNVVGRETQLPGKWTTEVAHYLGWLVGEGCLTDDAAVTVYGGGQDLEEVLPQHRALLTEAAGFEPTPSAQANGTYQLRATRGQWRALMTALGVLAGSSKSKRVPQAVFEAPEDAVTGFLRGLFDADGTVINQVAKGTRYVGLGSRSDILLRDVQELLASLGIHGRIYETGTKENSFRYVRQDGTEVTYGSDGPSFDLRISGRSIREFAARIGFSLSAKQQRLDTLLAEHSFYATDETVALVSREWDGWETTYNLTEPRNQSYIVSGVVVANCSEYMHLDNSSCNLASLNLLKFLRDDDTFDADLFQRAVEMVITAMDISISFADFPTEAIGETTRAYRQLGIGYANLGALLMATGHGYDSEGGRALAAAITSLMTGASYKRSAELAGVVGPYEGYARNADPHQRVMRKHAAAIDQVRTLGEMDRAVLQAATQAWQTAIETGERQGYRNAQASVLAPTGCLTGDTLVTTDRGLARLSELGDVWGERWQPLEALVSTDDGPQRATQFFVNGEEPTRRIVTEAGYRIQGTLTHRVKVVGKAGQWVWKRLADIAPGDLVPMQMGGLVGDPRRVPLPVLDQAYYAGDRDVVVPDSVDADLAELVGYFMGDGSLHARGVRFRVADADHDVVERLRILGKGLFNLEPVVTQQRGYQEVTLQSVDLARWWEAAGFANDLRGVDHAGKAWTPRIPTAIREANDADVYRAFLRGVFEADGTVLEGIPSVSTSSVLFADDLRTLLLTLGFPTTTRETVSGWGGPVSQVRIRNVQHAFRFGIEIGFMGGRKGALVAADASSHSGKRDHVHLPDDGRVGDVLGYLFEIVADNEDGGPQPTFDLSVPSNVTYVAAGFVSHNTIGFMMDCDTTGIEPDFSLVKFKKLVGGGSMQIVNQTVPRALRQLGYQEEQIEAIVEYIAEHGHVVDAPGLRPEHYEVFDCAMGTRSIKPMGHVRMMAAVQPFLSGAISKTVNLPEEATVEDIADVYFQGWKLGLKALAVYRDNCKVGQPLSDGKAKKAGASESSDAEPGVVVEYRPTRKRLPKKRPSQTVSFTVGGAEGYMTAGSYPDDGLGELFLKMSKQGSTLAGMMDAFSIAVSIGLQYGVPLETYVAKFTNMRFEPSGMTDDPDVRLAASVVDYIFRRLALDHLSFDSRSALGIYTAAERARQLETGVYEPVDEVDVEMLRQSAPVAEATGQQHVESEASTPTPTTEPPAASPPSKHDIGGAHTSAELLEALQGTSTDAPLCFTCGTKMRPAGSCYVCEGCGSTSGCS
ncbi:MAG TPA: LAGLIDADG family homing endonuclease [Jiangellales bacterium]|nr:LAGLIDADG family homing endonuclease [Jiangellales bacterium]